MVSFICVREILYPSSVCVKLKTILMRSVSTRQYVVRVYTLFHYKYQTEKYTTVYGGDRKSFVAKVPLQNRGITMIRAAFWYDLALVMIYYNTVTGTKGHLIVHIAQFRNVTI